MDFIELNNEYGGIIEKKEYWLTLDAGKYLAMMERNEMGFKARKYFIEAKNRLSKAIRRKSQQLHQGGNNGDRGSEHGTEFDGKSEFHFFHVPSDIPYFPPDFLDIHFRG